MNIPIMKMCLKKVEGINGPVTKIASAGFAIALIDGMNKVYSWDMRLQQLEESKDGE